MSINCSKIGRTDLEVSVLGFGGAPVGNLYGSMTDNDARDTLNSALQSGFSYFDTAPYYGFGLSEQRIGCFLQQSSDVQDVVLSTKVGRLLEPAPDEDVMKERSGFVSPMPFSAVFDYSYDGIMQSYEDSLRRLNVDKIDILLIHDIGRLTHSDAHEFYLSQVKEGGYKALDELRSSGDVQAIGLGVNEWQICEEVMEIGQFDCFLLAGRYTLLEQLALESFFPKCAEHGASVILGGAYNSGILATGTRGASIGFYNYEPAPERIVGKVQEIENVAENHNVTLAAAALQFPLAHDVIASVIPGLASAERVRQTIDLWNEKIPEDFWVQLKHEEILHPSAPIPRERV